jgi:preprotein translocase subunit SecG
VVDSPSRRRVLFVFALTAIALTATSLLVSNIQVADLGTGGESIQTFTNRIAEVMTTSLFILWGAIFIYLMIGVANSKRKGQKKVAAPPSNRAIVLGLFILAIWIILINWSGLNFSLFKDGGDVQDGNVPGDGSASSSAGGGGGSGTLVYIFFAILLVSLVAVYFMYNRRPSMGSFRHQVDMRDGRAEVGLVEKAMEELYQGNDFRSIIIRMYQHMCRLLIDRERSDERFLTPREFAALATEKLGWPVGPVKELTSLFEEARYSAHDIDETKKEKAMRYLEDIKTAIDLGSDKVDGGGITTADG